MGFKAWTREKAIEQFWARVDKTGPCWLWIGKGRGGSLHYGSLKLPVALADGVPRRTTLAHRVAFYLTRGYWPINTRHTCDTPLCCNPDHLIEGTQADNIHDCITRGRARNRPAPGAYYRRDFGLLLPLLNVQSIIGYIKRNPTLYYTGLTEPAVFGTIHLKQGFDNEATLHKLDGQ